DLERGNSNFDSRHRFVWSFSYDIPNLLKEHPRLGEGWQVNGVVTIRSGNPFHLNYNFTGDFNGTGEFFGRPDIIGDPFAGTNDSDRFLNLAAFKVPCTFDAAGECIPSTFHFGSLGRNSLPGPSYRNFDLSVFKTTTIKEQVKVQLRAEIFNIF